MRQRTVRITYDVERGNYPVGAPLWVPVEGDLLATVRKNNLPTGTVYFIESVREVRRRNPNAAPRFVLQCRPAPLGHRNKLRVTWFMRWYDRRPR